MRRRSPDDRRAALQRGRSAERFAAEHLCALGWTVLDRNWRATGGELDLVVCRDGALRFVEVKARTDGADGLEAITASKRAKLVRAAEAWLDTHEADYSEMAFMVAVVSLASEGWTLDLLDDAFDVSASRD